jgi:anion-transporting  ArsA/GET3 family ATPase
MMNLNPLIISGIILAVTAIILVVLYWQGNKLQKKQEEQRAQLMENVQQVTMLVIDKKRMPLKDAGLPKVVMEQAPKRARRAKVPVVKAKIGPKIMTFLTDEEVYDLIPVKAQIKAMISGIYITSINNYRKAPVPEPEKKGFMAKLRGKATSTSKELAEENAKKKK